MNREDVAMDVTVKNVEILRKEVQAAKLLLSECDEIFSEEGISNIELRGYLSGKLSADEVIELLDPSAEQRNQCDGCQAGIPLVDAAHRMGRPGGYPDLMSCQKERYEHHEQAEGAQWGREMCFRKKPVVIQAMQWTGDNLRQVITFTDGPPETRSMHAGMMWENYEHLVAAQGLKIYTLEGTMSADIGDWIIKGVKGEHYPCKPDVFAQTYERSALAQPSPAPELKCPKVIGYACLDDIQWGGDITLRPEKSEHYSVPFAPVVWTGQVPEGWKLVPEDATTEMVEALKARMTVTNRGTVLNAGHALNAAIAAAPAQGGEWP